MEDKEYTYIVFDLEATCWDDKDTENGYVPIARDVDQINAMEVIEIGAVAMKHTDEGLVLLDEYDAFVKPVDYPELSPFCKQLTSIQQRDVDMAGDVHDVFPEFIEWARSFTGEAKFVSWGMFDKAIFERMNKYQGKNLDIDYFRKNHFSAKHRWRKMGGPNAGLKRALKYFKMEFVGNHHRGIDDAKNIARIFNEIFDDCVTNYKR